EVLILLLLRFLLLIILLLLGGQEREGRLFQVQRRQTGGRQGLIPSWTVYCTGDTPPTRGARGETAANHPLRNGATAARLAASEIVRPCSQPGRVVVPVGFRTRVGG